MTKLTIENLALQYGAVEVLKGVSLSLNEGEILVLLGASGSGKTTLLRAVAGFETPSRGRIELDGQALFDGSRAVDVPPDRRGLGLVFQSYALWPHRTVDENIRYPLKLRKIPQHDQAARSAEVLGQLGLSHLRERYPHQLSGGQQQRVAVARALVYDPPVILLDEPLSNLDARLRDEAKAWLRGLIRDRRLSAILVTHDQAEALSMADQIALLADGRLEQIGAPQEIYQKPSSLISAEFFGNNNRLRGRIAEMRNGLARIEGATWSLWGRPIGEVKVNDSITAVVRVEAVSVSTTDTGNSLKLSLSQSMFAGDRWTNVFQFEDGAFTLNSARRLDQGEYDLSIDPVNVWLFPSVARNSAPPEVR